jgi:hypothetical protein
MSTMRRRELEEWGLVLVMLILFALAGIYTTMGMANLGAW